MSVELLKGEVDWSPIEWGAEFEDHGARRVDDLGLPVTYQTWNDATSRVVSGPYGIANFPGTRFPDRRTARLHWHLRSRIIEEYRLPGRWCFRIAKESHAEPEASQ